MTEEKYDLVEDICNAFKIYESGQEDFDSCRRYIAEMILKDRRENYSKGYSNGFKVCLLNYEGIYSNEKD